MRCPVCRAENNEEQNCRRCRADLSLLIQLENVRTRLLERAQQAAAQHNWPEVIRLADEAHSLRRDADLKRLLAVAWLMQRNFFAAHRIYQSMQRCPS